MLWLMLTLLVFICLIAVFCIWLLPPEPSFLPFVLFPSLKEACIINVKLPLQKFMGTTGCIQSIQCIILHQWQWSICLNKIRSKIAFETYQEDDSVISDHRMNGITYILYTAYCYVYYVQQVDFSPFFPFFAFLAT
jgi:hypothetical protein